LNEYSTICKIEKKAEKKETQMPWIKILYAIIAMMIFGLNAVFTKFGLSEFPPLLYNFLRFAFVLPAIFFIPRPAISWSMLLAIGLSLSIGHLSFACIGMTLGASAGTFVLIQQTGSIFAICFAYLLVNQKPSRYDLLGIALGLIGIYWFCASKDTEGGLLAIAALIGSSVTWGLGFTLVKKAHAPSLPTSLWTSIFAIPCMALASGLIEGPEAIISAFSNATLKGWSTLLFAGWVSLLGAGSLFMYLMRTEPVSKVVPFNMLVPLFGCLFAYLILGEQLTAPMLTGGAWILGGLMVSQFGAKLVHRYRPAPGSVS
jgi:O-acetylserine/cysteine efflux transporter